MTEIMNLAYIITALLFKSHEVLILIISILKKVDGRMRQIKSSKLVVLYISFYWRVCSLSTVYMFILKMYEV